MPFQIGQVVKRNAEKRYRDGTTIPAGAIGSVMAVTPGGSISVQYEDFAKRRLSDPADFTLVRGQAAREVISATSHASFEVGDRVHARGDIGSGDALVPAGTCGAVTGMTPGGMLVVEFDRGDPRRRLLPPGRIGAGCPR